MRALRTIGWMGASFLAAACGGGSSSTTHDGGGVDASKADGRPDALTDAGADRATPDASADSGLNPGEYCPAATPAVHFDPPVVVVAQGKTRPVRAIVEPDLCAPVALRFASDKPTVTAAPSSGTLDLRHASYDFVVTGGVSGTATLTASFPFGDAGAPITATLPITVNDGSLPSCATGDVATGTLSSSATTLSGMGGLAAAQLSVPPGAFSRTDELGLPSFKATVACASDDLTTSKPASSSSKEHPAAAGALVPIGPAVTFTAGAPLDMTHSLKRELDFSIPVNPAAIPTNGRLRHLQVLFMSPGSAGVTTAPQAITIANPQITPSGSGYVLQFSAPWFGTYQAAFSPDAGTVTRTRHLTHRAVLGFSMGAGGTAAFGFRHHDQFDVLAPLGGPSDWTWMLWYIEKFDLGGFCPHTDPNYPNCTTYAPNLYPLQETYAHSADFNHWFYQAGGGNGGTFSRSSYAQIFDDLALMHGNPNGQNFDPTAPNPDRSLSFLPAGPKATDPWVMGNPSGLPGTCAVAVNPIGSDPNPADPSNAVQSQWSSQCTTSRCDPANVWKAPTGYYDREYNPDGSKQVISFCEGGAQIAADSPYEDTWNSPQDGSDFPINVALAVDLNGDGIRQENEPVLRQGHEPWDDFGVDGVPDSMEPGYDPVTNPDPNQDDYDFQLNPNGTEGNHRWDTGEKFYDWGLDGVPGTKQLSQGGYDYGEGDGVFTTSTGLADFYATDAHSIVHQWSTPPGGLMTDDALLRLTIWADGGVRDLFNFGADANHLIGAVASRKVAAGGVDAGTQLRSTVFYDGFDRIPGQTPGNEPAFDVNLTRWADVGDAVNLRYGTVDATDAMIAAGDGQHVGSAQQLLDRLQTSIYAAIHQWPDADRTLIYASLDEIPSDADASIDAGLGTNCNGGLCTFPFASANRVGPVYVQLPPGYDMPESIQRNVRYPVIYALHGYGQTPDGLTAAAIVSTAYMDDPTRSEATRLGKAILVYVDGRCRYSSDTPAQPECIEGSFYLNSDRPDNAHPGENVAQFDTWFDNLLTYIDQNFRTMGPTDIQVTE